MKHNQQALSVQEGEDETNVQRGMDENLQDLDRGFDETRVQVPAEETSRSPDLQSGNHETNLLGISLFGAWVPPPPPPHPWWAAKRPSRTGRMVAVYDYESYFDRFVCRFCNNVATDEHRQTQKHRHRFEHSRWYLYDP